jgi:deoxyhypusine synthase
MEKNLPMVVPGWEDSTMAICTPATVITGDIENVHHGSHRHRVMTMLADCEYTNNATDDSTIGFFQIGGGIAGDFPICVVPHAHTRTSNAKTSPSGATSARSADSTTSYGSYSRRCPQRKK